MTGKSHLVTATTSASWTATILAAMGVSSAVCLVSIVVGAYAGLLPDIDHQRSTATWSMPPITNAISWTIRGAPVGLSLPIIGWGWKGRLLPWTCTHRGATHTPAGALVFGLVLGLPFCLLPAPFGGWTGMAFVAQVTVGCLAHLWSDARTTGGLRRRKGEPGRYTIGRTFTTDSDREHSLRRVVYTPIAILSVIGALLLIGALT